MDLSMATCNAEKAAAMKSTEYRKVIKPLLERRRRARINNCLDELKALILETAQSENTDASKLEKADILELTVQHLRTLRQQSRHFPNGPLKRMATAAAEGVVGGAGDKFRAGFVECAHEVSSFITSLGGVETEVKSRLVAHLSHCIGRMPPTVIYHPHPTTMEQHSPSPQHHHRLNTSSPSDILLPPSPISPGMSMCASPTTFCPAASSDYTVPVSPISPAPSPPYSGHYPAAGPFPGVRGEYYMWPASVDRDYPRSASRPSSTTSSHSSGELLPPTSSPVSTVGGDYYTMCCDRRMPSEMSPAADIKVEATTRPWRPW